MPGEIQVEQELYAPTRHFVGAHFARQVREHTPMGNLQIFVEDTSTTGGPESGYWSKPDVSALVLARGQFVPSWTTDLHTFEVKTAAGLNESAVHEANAHGRFGQYAWLVFQAVGRASADAPLFKKVVKTASQLGVGVIHFVDADTPRTWLIHLWARATGAAPFAADSFVRERFSPTVKMRVANHLKALGWPEIADGD